MHPDVRGGKKSMLDRTKSSQDPEIQKQLDTMQKRWERLGITFDNQAESVPPPSNSDLERACFRVMQFTHLMDNRLKKGRDK